MASEEASRAAWKRSGQATFSARSGMARSCGDWTISSAAWCARPNSSRPAGFAARFGPPLETVCGPGDSRTRDRREAGSVRRALLLPGRLQLQACRRGAARRPESVAGRERCRERDGARGGFGRCPPVARRMARSDRRQSGRPARPAAVAGAGTSVLRHPQRYDAPPPHRAVQGLSAQGRHDRHQFPGVSRTDCFPDAQEPDRGRRRDPRQARLLRRRHLSAAPRLAGRAKN